MDSCLRPLDVYIHACFTLYIHTDKGANMIRIACKCKTCRTNGALAIDVPDTFAPGVDRTKAKHGLVFQANHPVLGAGFRTQTGITLVAA